MEDTSFPKRRPCRLVICGGSSCAAAGRRRLMRTVYDALDEHALNEQVDIQISDCQDRCDDAPNLTLLPGAFPYARLTPDGVRRIIKQHIAQNQPVVELLASLKQHRKGKKRKR